MDWQAMSVGRSIQALRAFGASPAWAAISDLVVHCDRPLARPMGAIAAAFLATAGVHLRVFPTAPNAIAAQLARQIQNDIVVTQPFVLAQIEAAGLLADVARPGPWRSRLVIAARAGSDRVPLAQASIAAPDPVWGGGPDGPAMLAAAALRPAKLLGTFDTDEAHALLQAGDADYALLHETELVAGLEAVPMPGFDARLTYFAALTRAARRPNPEALLRFLAGSEAVRVLHGAGLEGVS